MTERVEINVDDDVVLGKPADASVGGAGPEVPSEVLPADVPAAVPAVVPAVVPVVPELVPTQPYTAAAKATPPSPTRCTKCRCCVACCVIICVIVGVVFAIGYSMLTGQVVGDLAVCHINVCGHDSEGVVETAKYRNFDFSAADDMEDNCSASAEDYYRTTGDLLWYIGVKLDYLMRLNADVSNLNIVFNRVKGTYSQGVETGPFLSCRGDDFRTVKGINNLYFTCDTENEWLGRLSDMINGLNLCREVLVETKIAMDVSALGMARTIDSKYETNWDRGSSCPPYDEVVVVPANNTNTDFNDGYDHDDGLADAPSAAVADFCETTTDLKFALPTIWLCDLWVDSSGMTALIACATAALLTGAKIGEYTCQEEFVNLTVYMGIEFYNPTVFVATVHSVYATLYFEGMDAPWAEVVIEGGNHSVPSYGRSRDVLEFTILPMKTAEEQAELLETLTNQPQAMYDVFLYYEVLGISTEIDIHNNKVGLLSYSEDDGDSDDGQATGTVTITPETTVTTTTIPTASPTEAPTPGGFGGNVPGPGQDDPSLPADGDVARFFSGICYCVYYCDGVSDPTFAPTPAPTPEPTPPPTNAPTEEPTSQSEIEGVCCSPGTPSRFGVVTPECNDATMGTCTHDCGVPCSDPGGEYDGHESGFCTEAEIESAACTFFRPGTQCLSFSPCV